LYWASIWGGLLIAISALGSLIALVVPPYVIGLLGIVPIAIGANRLVQVIKKEDKISSASLHTAKESTNRRNKQYLPFLAVAAVKFSNGGGQHWGLYSNVCTIQLCKSSYYTNSSFHGNDCPMVYGSNHLVNHPLVASSIRRIGHVVMPFVLIGLGLYILVQAFLISSFLGVSVDAL
jgi:cadmium resistance protein CadD (predicted permease)